jgi:hypothetical protein
MQLSYSALGIYKDCKCCFWLDRNKKITRPRGIFSSLPIGIDNILKEKLEVYRGSLPPALANYPELQGFQLYAGKDLKAMRNWKTNPMQMEDGKGNILVGAFDDLLFNPTTQEYAMLDYKTKGSEPDQAYCEKYYQSQIDIYTRFLELGKRKVASFGVLFYFYPIPIENGLIEFLQKPFFLTPNTENAEKLFKEAILCLEGGLPQASVTCEYCSYHQKLTNYERMK